MKNGKSEIVPLVSRAIRAVLIICACLLGDSAQAQEPKPVIKPDKTYGEGGTNETITAKTGPNTETVTFVRKDPGGVERFRSVTTTEPNDTYGGGGTKETEQRVLVTDTEVDPDNGDLLKVDPHKENSNFETIRDSKKVIREYKVTITYPGQGKRKQELVINSDCNKRQTYFKEVRTGVLGEETYYEERQCSRSTAQMPTTAFGYSRTPSPAVHTSEPTPALRASRRTLSLRSSASAWTST